MGFLIFLQTIFAILLVTAVLMHAPKGEGMGAIGGRANVFNVHSDLERGLDQATLIFASGFFIISLIIALIS
jgi:protein translocase SecG subunit